MAVLARSEAARAGGKGFSTYNYHTVIYYGLKGDIKSGTSAGYLWPGTQAVSGSFPDPGTPPGTAAAYYRVQQPSLISGIAGSISNPPGTGHTVTILIRVTPVGGSITNTPFTFTFGAADLFKTFYDASYRVNSGDQIHAYLTYTGNNGNTAHDLTLQIDIF